MRLDENGYGYFDGAPVRKFQAIAAQGLEVTVSNYGATIISVRSPDREGQMGEITLGFDELSGYVGSHPYFGATVGRYANRIRNGSFSLDGKEFILARNDGAHHLHGGMLGFGRVLWEASSDSGEDFATVTFSYVSRDGEEGYPGELEVSVAYVVTDNNRLKIEYRARGDQPTPVNLTNHTYWNLDRPGCDVRDHDLRINSNSYLAVDDGLIPTGRLLNVESGPFDFRKTKKIREDFESSGGYDHNFVLAGEPGRVRMAAELYCEQTGRMMSVMTDQPALQLYTSNMLEKCAGRDGIEYDRYGALCLETGALNDSVHHANFPKTVLRPGDRYSHTTIHEFKTDLEIGR